MKKKLISFLTVVGMMASLVVPAQSVMADETTLFSGGSGTADDPYKISTAADLQKLASDVNDSENEYTYEGTYFKVTNDIDLSSVCSISSEASWTPIGYKDNETVRSFAGIFDGVGYTIYSMYIGSSDDYQGLFGYFGGDENADAAIKNVNIANSDIQVGSNVGGICGYNAGVIEYCSVAGSINGNSNVGGICGYNAGTMTGCYSNALVNSDGNSGGVCGWNNGTIKKCYNTGMVMQNVDYSGGVCGWNNGTIEDCYNAGSLMMMALLENSHCGGVCGYSATHKILNCYYLADTASVGVGGTTEDTEEMTTSATNDQFASGEVCYLLNAKDTAWYQNISTTEQDSYPVLDSTHLQVYKNVDTYSNINVKSVASAVSSAESDRGDYAYGYNTSLYIPEGCAFDKLTWEITNGSEGTAKVSFDDIDTTGLEGNAVVGLILTKSSDSTIDVSNLTLDAYVE